MKLLVITQILDEGDDVLGFMHGWVEEFARQSEVLDVICLKMGKYSLPQNVSVFSLGKERGCSRLKYLINFYKYIFKERKNYDAVFVHMNPEYVLLGGFLWRLLWKNIGLWYAHGYASWHLKIAEKMADIIFTSTKSGCRINSSKIKIVGQGIDVNKFRNKSRREVGIPTEASGNQEIFQIISVGRISPVKDYGTLISSAEILKNLGLSFKVDIVGGVGLREQEEYLSGLKKIVLD